LDENRSGPLKLLLIIQLTQNFRSGVIAPILALFIRRQGLTVSQIGLLGIAGMLGWLIFEPISGVVADRVRKRYMIFFAVMASTFIFVAYPFTSDIWHFAFLAFARSSVMSAYAISVKAMTAELLPVNERGKTYGRFLSVISMGGIVAPILGGYLSETYDYTIPFYTSAAIGVVSLAAVTIMKYDEKLVEEASIETATGDSKLMTRPFISILTVRALFMFNLIFRHNFLPIYLNESPRFQASEAEIGAFMGIVRVTSALSQAIIGDFTDRVGSKLVMVSSVGLLGLSYMGMVYMGGILPLYVLGALQGVFMPAANMSMMIHLMAIMPEGRTGMVMGLYSEAENVGGMVTSPSLGFIYDGFGPASSVLTVSGILIFTAIISLALIGEDSRKRGAETATQEEASL
jgi:MFS family permease